MVNPTYVGIFKTGSGAGPAAGEGEGEGARLGAEIGAGAGSYQWCRVDRVLASMLKPNANQLIRSKASMKNIQSCPLVHLSSAEVTDVQKIE